MTKHVVACCLDLHLGCLQGYLGNWIRIAGVWDFMLEYGACILDYGLALLVCGNPADPGYLQ